MVRLAAAEHGQVLQPLPDQELKAGTGIRPRARTLKYGPQRLGLDPDQVGEASLGDRAGAAAGVD
jgi:hypothetical protein